MRQALTITVLILGGLLSITGYSMAIIDWLQDIQEGVYRENPFEAVLETSAIVFYTFLAVRFTRNKVNL